MDKAGAGCVGALIAIAVIVLACAVAVYLYTIATTGGHV